MRIAVIGGGVAGLTCAIRLAQKNHDIVLFEAAPELGGRTRSFFDSTVNEWVDNGPHLLAGAYQSTRRLLEDCGAAKLVHWQASLHLPLWRPGSAIQRLAPPASLPIACGLPWACYRLQGHDMSSLAGIFRLSLASHRGIDSELTAKRWLNNNNIPERLQKDLLEPLCLGAMNEELETANAKSFARVLRESFASHETARLGWFRDPLSQALVKPLEEKALGLGVKIHKGCRVEQLIAADKGIAIEAGNSPDRFDRVVIALTAKARNTLLGTQEKVETRPITNIHLWFHGLPPLPEPLIGGLGTHAHWFFDISQQHGMSDNGQTALRHICAVISADACKLPAEQRIQMACRELSDMLGLETEIRTRHHRIVCERHATMLTRSAGDKDALPPFVIDASEQPEPGSLPATIELAVQRGEMAAIQAIEPIPA